MKRWLPGFPAMSSPAMILTTTALIAVALGAVPLDAVAQAKDTLTVALPSHAPTLDPHMHFERVGILVNINMFDSLLHRSAKLAFEPSLALSWKALNDTTWEFKLRQGVKFHDGSTMTAEDVKYSFDRVLEPGKEKKKSPQYGNVRAIKDVKIVDADTIQLITDKPFPLLLERVVFFPIVPKKHIEKVGEEAFGSTAAVGTGPWKLVEWKRDQHIRLEAFDGHWRGKPEVKPFPYDPKKAKELLAQSGYPNGTDITLHSSTVAFRSIFEAMGQMLTEVGLRTTVKMWDPGPAWNKFFQAEGKATHGHYASWGNYSVFDADAVLHPLYHTEPGGWIGKHYARVEGLDKLIDEARSSIDQPKRKRIYAEIQRMIREEAPSIFLYTQNDTLGISKKVAYEARPDE